MGLTWTTFLDRFIQLLYTTQQAKHITKLKRIKIIYPSRLQTFYNLQHHHGDDYDWHNKINASGVDRKRIRFPVLPLTPLSPQENTSNRVTLTSNNDNFRIR